MLGNALLLDNQSTAHMFCNSNYAKQMWKTSETMYLSMNGGTLAVNQQGSTGNFGNVWHHPKAIANVLSCWRVLNQAGPSNIGFDSKANLFWVNANGCCYEFRVSSEGLHCCVPGPVPVNESVKETETHRNKAVSFFQQARLEDFQCLQMTDETRRLCAKREHNQALKAQKLLFMQPVSRIHRIWQR